MKIEPISNGNLRIWLAENEIEEWGLDRGRRGVRRLVRHALAAAGQSSALRVETEMIPVDGGWVLVVSPQVHSRLPAVYEVDEDSLREVSARWTRVSKGIAQVYTVNNRYHIVAYDADTEWLLREYGRPIGEGAGVVAHTAEYGEWVGEITAPAPPLPGSEDRAH